MIKDENILKIYDEIILDKEINTKKLNELGFTSNDITNLVRDETLKRLTRGVYTLANVTYLFFYAKELFYAKEYDKSFLCYQRCYEINPECIEAVEQLFLRSASRYDYESAIKYVKVMSEYDDRFKNDANFYLYLSSFLTNLPDELKNEVKYFSLKDMLLAPDDDRFENVDAINSIRGNAFYQKFNYAIKLSSDYIKEHKKVDINSAVIFKLLPRIVERQNKDRERIIGFINDDNYGGIINLLVERQNEHPLSKYEIYVLHLVNKINNQDKSFHIGNKDDKDVFAAIDAQDYFSALDLANKFMEHGYDANNFPLNLLLEKIVKMIKGEKVDKKESTPLKVKNIVVKEEAIKEDNLDHLTKEKDEKIINNTNYVEIIPALISKDYSKALGILDKYLKDNNKENYRPLIIELIKLSIMKEDITYSNPMFALTLINKEKFSFDVSKYLKDFYEDLANDKLDEAKINLNILSLSNSLNQNFVLVEPLELLLNNMEKINGTMKTEDKLSDFNSALNGVSIKKEVEEVIIEENKEDISDEELFNDEYFENIEEIDLDIDNDDDKEFSDIKDLNDSEKYILDIEKKLMETNDPAIVLKKLSERKITELIRLCKSNNKLDCFTITTSSKDKFLVIKRLDIDPSDLDYIKSVEDAKSAKQNRDYKKVIEINSRILRSGKNSSRNYANIGLAYLKLHRKEDAIDYLNVATYLARMNNDPVDYDEFVAKISKEEYKGFVNMNEKDFKDKDYGITSFAELKSKVFNEKVDVNEAMDSLKLTDEEKVVALLLLGREYYYKGLNSQGDKYLIKAEKSPNKSKLAISLLTEIRKNKLFYKNRIRKN